MKKLLIYLSLILSVIFLSSCVKNPLDINKEKILVSDNYTIELTDDKNVSYKILEEVNGVSLDGATFKIDNSVKSGTQILVGIYNKDTFIATIIAEVSKEGIRPTITFNNLSENITDGDKVSAKSNPALSVSYSLKNNPVGISINSSSGLVHFIDSVAHGTKFTVIAKAGESSEEKEFTYVKDNLIELKSESLFYDYQSKYEVEISLDFKGDSEALAQGILGVQSSRGRLETSQYSFNSETQKLIIDSSFLDTLPLGFHTLTLATSKNTVSVEILVAYFISTAEELASINNTVESLNSYYVLTSDIDLKEYLKEGSVGYNDGKGWNPIGKYNDTLDSTSTMYAFQGYFDGNGHTVSNYYINRNDERGFNSGFFGYVGVNAIIKNLNVSSDKTKEYKVCSYSGGFVGANTGTIMNCSADTNVSTNDDVHRVIGGFVGRNEGIISNSYSLGNVASSNQAGQFSGVNMATIENCATIGSIFDSAATPSGSRLFDSLEEFNSSWEEVLVSPWVKGEGDMPTITSVELKTTLKALKITNEINYVTKGDQYALSVEVVPSSLASTTLISYEIVEGNGVTVNSQGVVNTTQAQGDHFIVKISSQDVSVLHRVDVYQKPKSIQFSDTQEYNVYPGDYIKLDGYVLPSNARQDILYTITTPMAHVSMYQNGIIRIDREAQTGSFEVTATIRDISKKITIHVIGYEEFDGNKKYLLSDRNEDVVFTLDSSIISELQAVKAYSKAIAYRVEGNNVIISHDTFIKDLYGITVPVDFITSTKTYKAEIKVYENQYDSFYDINPENSFLGFEGNDYSIAKDYTEDVRVTLPDTIKGIVTKVCKYYDDVNYALSDELLTISFSEFKDFAGKKVPIIIKTSDNKEYLLKVKVYNSAVESFYKLTMNEDIEFSSNAIVKDITELNQELELTVDSVKSVKVYYTDVTYTVESNKIKLNISNLTNNLYKKIPIVITKEDNSRVGFSLIILSNKEEDIIISSKEEFIAFKSDKANFNKNVILVSDIDFGNMNLTSIGYNKEDDGAFTGKFYGNGYTLKNLYITRNDFSGEYMSEGEMKGDETVNKYHNSFYVVGLFAVLKGELYDLTLENVHVCPTFNSSKTGNYVGIVAGKLEGKAININLINSTSDAAADGSQRVVGIVYAAISSGAVYEVYYNGELLEGGN